jgi:hypothetical protein
MTEETKKPANKIKLNRSQIREALTQIPLETIIQGEGKKRTLTKKQTGFIKDVAMGKTKAQAYRDNYNTKTKAKYQGDAGSKMAKNPVINQEIEAFKVALLAKEYQTGTQLKAFIMHQLTQHALNEDNPPASRIRSLELLGKSYDVGLFVERKEITTINNSGDIKAKLIEQLREVMNKNAITVEYDDGDSLLEELRGDADEILLADTHYTPTPLNEPMLASPDMHSIPHIQSPEIDDKNNKLNLQPIDSVEENQSSINVYRCNSIEKDENEGVGGVKNPEKIEEIAVGNTPVNDLEQKG